MGAFRVPRVLTILGVSGVHKVLWVSGVPGFRGYWGYQEYWEFLGYWIPGRGTTFSSCQFNVGLNSRKLYTTFQPGGYL